MKPICAWISRHEPTDEQRWALQGYRIVVVHTLRQRLRTPAQIYAEAARRCGRRPDVMVAVLPPMLLARLVEYVDPLPVVQAPGWWDGAKFHWKGYFRQVTGVALKYAAWSP